MGDGLDGQSIFLPRFINKTGMKLPTSIEQLIQSKPGIIE